MKKLDQNYIQSLIKLLNTGQLIKLESFGKELLKEYPNETFLYNIVATSLAKQNKFNEAINKYRDLLSIDPNHSEALNNLAVISAGKGNINDAIANYKHALKIKPNYTEALSNLAYLLKSIGNISKATECYKKVFSKNKDDIRYAINAALLIPPIIESHESIDLYRNKYKEGLISLKKYQLNLSNTINIILPQTFFLSYHAKDNLEIMKSTAKTYRKIMPNLNFISKRTNNIKRKKIKVGFVSQFLTMHTIGKLFGGLIKNLNNDKFEKTIFHTPQTKKGGMKDSIDYNVDKIINLKSTIQEQQNQISKENLDILFYPDIGMSPTTYFLAFSRFAPVQIVSWGHPETTGIDTIDYFLSSTLFETEISKKNYSEKLICLNTFPIYYEPPENIKLEKNRLDFNLPLKANLYACPQSLFKLHPDFDLILAKILEKDPNGYIVFIGGPGIIKYWINILKNRWSKSFPIINSRSIFMNRLSLEEFICFCKCVDVLLDPVHFGGGNSFLEAMLVGTPTITKPSTHLRANITSAGYKQMNISNSPIVYTSEEYVNLSINLAKNRNKNIKLRKDSVKAAKNYLFKNNIALMQFEKFLEKAHFEAKSGNKIEDGYVIKE